MSRFAKPTFPAPGRLPALALAGVLASAAPALAADLDEVYGVAPPPAPVARVLVPEALPPPPPPRLRPPPVAYDVRAEVVETVEPCRVFLKTRFDAYGREVVHRVRVCDEGAVDRPRRWVAGPAPYGYGPRDVVLPPRPVPLPPRDVEIDLDGDPG